MNPKRRRPLKARPMDLRHAGQRQVIARFVLLGWDAERIARKLGRSARAIRYAISTPEFETDFQRLQKEQFKAVDRQMGALLGAAVGAAEASGLAGQRQRGGEGDACARQIHRADRPRWPGGRDDAVRWRAVRRAARDR